MRSSALVLILAACGAAPADSDLLPADALGPPCDPAGPTAPVVDLLPLGAVTEADRIQIDLVSPSLDTCRVRYRATWFVNSRAVQNQGRVYRGRLLDGRAFNRGDLVHAEVRAVNLAGASSPAARTSSVVVGNSPPEVDSVEITPPAPTDIDDLVPTVTCTDADGDPVVVTFDWFIDGIEVSSSATLSSILTNPGDRVELLVTCYDGTEFGDPASAGPVIIQP